jgi:cell division protein FtsL
MLAERVLPQVDYHDLIEPAAAPSRGEATRKRRRKNRSLKQKKLIRLLAAALIYGLILVALTLQGSMLSYRITTLKSDISLIETANYQYEYQIQQLSSLDRVEMIAVNELDMVKPEWQQAYMMAAIPAAPEEKPETLLLETQIPDQGSPLAKVYGMLSALYIRSDR